MVEHIITKKNIKSKRERWGGGERKRERDRGSKFGKLFTQLSKRCTDTRLLGSSHGIKSWIINYRVCLH